MRVFFEVRNISVRTRTWLRVDRLNLRSVLRLDRRYGVSSNAASTADSDHSVRFSWEPCHILRWCHPEPRLSATPIVFILYYCLNSLVLLRNSLCIQFLIIVFHKVQVICRLDGLSDSEENRVAALRPILERLRLPIWVHLEQTGRPGRSFRRLFRYVVTTRVLQSLSLVADPATVELSRLCVLELAFVNFNALSTLSSQRHVFARVR